MKGVQRVLCWAWFHAWRHWLWDDYFSDYWRPIKVTGWRSALCDLRGYRQGICPCFWWFQ